MNDKRKFRRFHINLSALLSKADLNAVPVTVTAADASFGGIGLICAEELSPESLVTLMLDRPPFAPGTQVILKGRVVSSRRKPTLQGKFAISIAYEDHDIPMAQKLVNWAQMQSLVQAKARTKAIGQAKTRTGAFYS